MILETIENLSKDNNVRVYFDMDGVLASYDMITGLDYAEKGFYTNKRPILASIQFAQYLSKIKNVEVYILSNCHYTYQRNEKLEWLQRHAPFIKKDNINIICFEEFNEDVDLIKLKANFFEETRKLTNDKLIIIDDDIRHLNQMQQVETLLPYHVSALIEEFDFIKIKNAEHQI